MPSLLCGVHVILDILSMAHGARRLIGLCSYNLGEYDKALFYLKELKNPDEDSIRALMLAQVFSTQQQGKHFCQIDTLDTFDDND